VALGLVLASISAPALAAKGRSVISGVLQVHQANGAYVPLVGVEVELDDTDAMQIESEITADDGSFSFSDVDSGQYRVSTSAYADFSGNDSLVTDINGTAYPSLGTYRYVRVGSLVATIDATLTIENALQLGHVSGSLTDQNGAALQQTVGSLDGGASLAPAEVTFEDASTGKSYSVQSNSAGSYAIDVPLGNYFVSVGCEATDTIECTFLGNVSSKAASTQLNVTADGATDVSIRANTQKSFTVSEIGVTYGAAQSYFGGETISAAISTNLAEIGTAAVSYQWFRVPLNSSSVAPEAISGATSKDLVVPSDIAAGLVLFRSLILKQVIKTLC